MDSKSDRSNDWRLHGQERYLRRVPLQFVAWSSVRAEWDHDHCEFCGAKFAGPALADTLHEGYTTSDLDRWICPKCFADFRERFEWIEPA